MREDQLSTPRPSEDRTWAILVWELRCGRGVVSRTLHNATASRCGGREPSERNGNPEHGYRQGNHVLPTSRALGRRRHTRGAGDGSPRATIWWDSAGPHRDDLDRRRANREVALVPLPPRSAKGAVSMSDAGMAEAVLQPRQDISVVAVVLPCLNEEESLLSTCRSLGFGTSGVDQAPQAVLIIVDNGSTDNTISVAREIQNACLPGTVIIGREKERGYVPPRHRGNGLAKRFAEAHGMHSGQVLVLQTDADTLYQQDYIEQMRLAAQAAGANTLLEARAEFPPGFQNSFPGYVALLAETDDRFFRTINFRAADDLVCTDAVCGYRLSDYLAWGGHIREYRKDGEEIHAETTRLRIRSVAHGAGKVLVEDAVALPSERKTLLRPAEEFATAGFPRESGWRAAWRRKYTGPDTAEAFGTARDHPDVVEAIRLRERHLAALFGLLPLHAAKALGAPPATADPRLFEIVASLPAHDANTLLHQPGQLLVDVLDVVDHRGATLDALFGGGTGASRN
jgi:hypothetical protein